MRHMIVRLHLFLLFLLHPLTSDDLQEAGKVEVIVQSSPCSATCGLGVKVQTLCLLKDGAKAMDEGQAEVSDECRDRKVKCLESWLCQLKTITVTSGQRVELDCLREVMEVMGRFSLRVSWRYARGIISTDNALFSRWDAPQLDRVVLDAVREDDAGTYRCDVQDSSFRRVKRMYWGIRVLPVGVLNLDYESSLARWDFAEKYQSRAVPDEQASRMPLVYVVLIGSSLAGITAGLILLLLYLTAKTILAPAFVQPAKKCRN